MVGLSLQRLAHGLMLQLVVLTDPVGARRALHITHLHVSSSPAARSLLPASRGSRRPSTREGEGLRVRRAQGGGHTVKRRPPCSQTSLSHSTQTAPAMGQRHACLQEYVPSIPNITDTDSCGMNGHVLVYLLHHRNRLLWRERSHALWFPGRCRAQCACVSERTP